MVLFNFLPFWNRKCLSVFFVFWHEPFDLVSWLLTFRVDCILKRMEVKKKLAGRKAWFVFVFFNDFWWRMTSSSGAAGLETARCRHLAPHFAHKFSPLFCMPTFLSITIKRKQYAISNRSCKTLDGKFPVGRFGRKSSRRRRCQPIPIVRFVGA